MNTNYTNTSYFTFGQMHVHRLPNITLDKNIVIKITARDPRAKMFELFGEKWAMQYQECPDLKYFSRGVYDLKKKEVVTE